MTDTGAHPGVRSLLARFENNQNATSSPPPRGRSPVGSDASGASRRPLSKVRASFIAVEGDPQNGPMVGLRRISGPSDSPPPPSRVRSFNSDDLDGSVKSLGSSIQTSNGLGSAQKMPEKAICEDTPRGSVEIVTTQKDSKGVATPANKENQPALNAPAVAPSKVSSPKPTKVVSKRPSTVHVGKSVPTSKTTSLTAGSKSSTQPRTPTSPNKPDSDKATKASRTSRTSTIKSGVGDSPKMPVHKPSRASLNPTTKPATRPTRSSPPARDATKLAPRASDVRSQSSSRSSRPPASANATKQGNTSTLNRKPSSLRVSGSTIQRAVTPTATSIRKQTSRPAPSQSGNERPQSRFSNGSSKPVDEGFLARMMRPTASSASKAHEKVEIKSPPRGKPAHTARRVVSRAEISSQRQTKEKNQVQEQKAVSTEVASGTTASEEKPHIESTDDKTIEKGTPGLPTEVSNSTVEPVDKLEEKFIVNPPHEIPTDSSASLAEGLPDSDVASKENVISPGESPNVTPASDENSQQPTETPDLVAPITGEPALPPDEAATPKETEPSEPAATESTEKIEPTETEASTITADETGADTCAEPASLEADSKPNEVDIDMSKLTIN